jgi:hypothetical protein
MMHSRFRSYGRPLVEQFGERLLDGAFDGRRGQCGTPALGEHDAAVVLGLHPDHVDVLVRSERVPRPW